MSTTEESGSRTCNQGILRELKMRLLDDIPFIVFTMHAGKPGRESTCRGWRMCDLIVQDASKKQASEHSSTIPARLRYIMRMILVFQTLS